MVLQKQKLTVVFLLYLPPPLPVFALFTSEFADRVAAFTKAHEILAFLKQWLAFIVLLMSCWVYAGSPWL